ncbi:hypothetical protein SCUCBS95973_005759 [Sporothrix curviconia]|uniref:CENP-V/GFA domain-containing protein n=1 Tax=Sporothrix curviconia TaxID=1260050 RepID=A0ABP0C1M7_9PEZI
MAELTPTPAPASPTELEPTAESMTATSAAGGPPGLVITCQCGQCRRQSASAFGTSVYFPPAKGFYPLDPALTAAGGLRQHHVLLLLPGCGVRLLHAVILPDGSIRPRVSVKGGAIEDPDGVLDWASAKHIFVRSAVIPLCPTWETYDTTLGNGPRFVPPKEST